MKLAVTKGNKTESVEVDTVLVAVGRGPATDGLDLERWGVSDRSRLHRHRRREPRGATACTRSATARRRRRSSRTSRSGWAWRRPSDSPAATPIPVDFERGVPHATYCVPEVASVGLTEAQAKEQGYDVKVTKHSFAGNARAQMMHAARGFAKLVAGRDGAILGMHLIGPRVTELLAESLLDGRLGGDAARGGGVRPSAPDAVRGDRRSRARSDRQTASRLIRGGLSGDEG